MAGQGKELLRLIFSYANMSASQWDEWWPLAVEATAKWLGTTPDVARQEAHQRDGHDLHAGQAGAGYASIKCHEDWHVLLGSWHE